MKQPETNPAKPSAATAEIASAGAAQEASTTATEQEIERARAEWVRGQRAKHLEFVRQFRFHKSNSFMDYLHGDVKPEEAFIACLYEYMRESRVLREAAGRRDELKLKGPDWFTDVQRAKWKGLSSATRAEQAGLWAVEESREQPLFLMEILSFLACESFPQQDWQELSATERQPILQLYELRKTSPLRLPDLRMLKAMRILDTFQAMGGEAKPVVGHHDPQRVKFVGPSKPVPAILQQHGSFYNVIFTLDFSERETHIVERFRAWLKKTPEIQKLLSDYKKPRPKLADESLDRLKDLAAWRLCREHNNSWQAANRFGNEHRKGRKRFRDAKSQRGTRANEANLFGNADDAREAEAGAWKHLVKVMPTEFEPEGPDMLSAFVEIGKLASEP